MSDLADFNRFYETPFTEPSGCVDNDETIFENYLFTKNIFSEQRQTSYLILGDQLAWRFTYERQEDIISFLLSVAGALQALLPNSLHSAPNVDVQKIDTGKKSQIWTQRQIAWFYFYEQEEITPAKLKEILIENGWISAQAFEDEIIKARDKRKRLEKPSSKRKLDRKIRDTEIVLSRLTNQEARNKAQEDLSVLEGFLKDFE